MKIEAMTVNPLQCLQNHDGLNRAERVRGRRRLLPRRAVRVRDLPRPVGAPLLLQHVREPREVVVRVPFVLEALALRDRGHRHGAAREVLRRVDGDECARVVGNVVARKHPAEARAIERVPGGADELRVLLVELAPEGVEGFLREGGLLAQRRRALRERLEERLQVGLWWVRRTIHRVSKRCHVAIPEYTYARNITKLLLQSDHVDLLADAAGDVVAAIVPRRDRIFFFSVRSQALTMFLELTILIDW